MTEPTTHVHAAARALLVQIIDQDLGFPNVARLVDGRIPDRGGEKAVARLAAALNTPPTPPAPTQSRSAYGHAVSYNVNVGRACDCASLR